jgi:hypothetical protein
MHVQYTRWVRSWAGAGIVRAAHVYAAVLYVQAYQGGRVCLIDLLNEAPALHHNKLAAICNS